MQSPRYFSDPMAEEGDLFLGSLMADSAISDLDISRQSYSPEVKENTSKTERSAMKALHSPLRHSANQAKPRNTQVSKGWEDDAVDLDSSELPSEHAEFHHDLAERIDYLTRTIQTNAQFCIEASGKIIALAQENRSIYSAAGETLSTYVLQPCLKLGGALKSHPAVNDGLQALKDFEPQLRQAIANYANGVDMARIGRPSAEDEAEVRRLKDRLVEQDALLQDSSQHMQRLMRERDLLRRKLTEESTEAREAMTDRVVEAHHACQKSKVVENERVFTADQLRELRLLVDQLAIHQVKESSPHALRIHIHLVGHN
jgi:hypothetical protein